jgi:hypothetical protein
MATDMQIPTPFLLLRHIQPWLPWKYVCWLLQVMDNFSLNCKFLDQLYGCGTMFISIQTKVTEIFIYKGGRTHAEDLKIKKLKYLTANHFTKKYELKKLSESEVVEKSNIKKMMVNMDPKAEEGSYADLFKKSILQLLQRLKILKDDVLSMAVQLQFPQCVDGFKLG